MPVPGRLLVKRYVSEPGASGSCLSFAGGGDDGTRTHDPLLAKQADAMMILVALWPIMPLTWAIASVRIGPYLRAMPLCAPFVINL